LRAGAFALRGARRGFVFGRGFVALGRGLVVLARGLVAVARGLVAVDREREGLALERCFPAGVAARDRLIAE
jgi:hypothetical protein